MEAQMKQRGFDPEGTRLPIKLDTTSNGEFMPVPLDGANRRANRLAQQWASENARRRGLGRRAFMVSACGAASTLLAFNRSEERRVGKECVSPCRSRWAPYHKKKKNTYT